MKNRPQILITLSFVLLANPAFALITGGGAEAVQDRGWPEGSVELANLKTRIAYWEGPPFGGGQYTFEYSGETADLQKAIDLFDKVHSKRKQLVISVGSQPSFWLNIGDRNDGKKKKMIDWPFVVWVPASWKQLNQGGGRFLPPGQEGDSPLTQMNVFVTDRIDWQKVNVPESLMVIDQRLEANGIAKDEGGALRGTVTDADGQPIANATIKLEQGDKVIEATSNADGTYLIKKIPAGNHQVKIGAEGFAPKSAYYHAFTPTTYRQIETQLAKAATVTVRLVDVDGKKVPNVKIRISECHDRAGNHYRLATRHDYTSDENGEIVVSGIPEGKVKFGSATREYYYNSVLNQHDTDEKTIVLNIQRTGSLLVSIVTKDGTPVTSKYNVSIAPEGAKDGGGVGTWGGSANVREDGTVIFHNIPPDRYVLTGKPNPGRVSDTTDPIVVEIKGKDRYSIEMVTK